MPALFTNGTAGHTQSLHIYRKLHATHKLECHIMCNDFEGGYVADGNRERDLYANQFMHVECPMNAQRDAMTWGSPAHPRRKGERNMFTRPLKIRHRPQVFGGWLKLRCNLYRLQPAESSAGTNTTKTNLGVYEPLGSNAFFLKKKKILKEVVPPLAQACAVLLFNQTPRRTNEILTHRLFSRLLVVYCITGSLTKLKIQLSNPTEHC